jgi:dihydrofolate reductase
VIPPLAIIAAIGRNGVIGYANRLPWHLSSDLKRFKAITMGKPLIMGRKTFQSIGRALPGRETIVVTRDPDFAVPAGVHLAHGLDHALALAAERAEAMGADEIILAGGGDLYNALIDRADRLYLTLVDLAPDGDAHFPSIEPDQWIEVSRENPAPLKDDEAGFSWVTYRRAIN